MLGPEQRRVAPVTRPTPSLATTFQLFFAMEKAFLRTLTDSLGRIAVVQADSRFCSSPAEPQSQPDAAAAAYWWKSVALTGQWASRHGYSHFCFCVRRCVRCKRMEARERSMPGSQRALRGRLVPGAAWCKLRAMAFVLRSKSYDSAVFLEG